MQTLEEGRDGTREGGRETRRRVAMIRKLLFADKNECLHSVESYMAGGRESDSLVRKHRVL